MSRPLLITDCDEVLLHMVVPFAGWLDEAHRIHFDIESGDFANALRHKETGAAVEHTDIWPLLSGFFATEMHRQYPIDGAIDALNALASHADIVVLTNIGDEAGKRRADHLAELGIAAPVIGNHGGKGGPVRELIEEYRPSVAVFVDDLANQHDSVARHAPDVFRLHMVGEPRLAAVIPHAPAAQARIDDWRGARRWIMDRFEGVALS